MSDPATFNSDEWRNLGYYATRKRALEDAEDLPSGSWLVKNWYGQRARRGTYDKPWGLWIRRDNEPQEPTL